MLDSNIQMAEGDLAKQCLAIWALNLDSLGSLGSATDDFYDLGHAT